MKIDIIFYFVLFFILSFEIQGQISPPYYCDFNEDSDPGWNHYSIIGNDDWQKGLLPQNSVFAKHARNEVLVTKLNGEYSQQSIMCLETPAFDLSGSAEYILSFSHLYQTSTYDGGNIEYSIDDGQTWSLLEGESEEKNLWHGSEVITKLEQCGWTGQVYNNEIQLSSHSLIHLQGKTNVKFRFQFGSSSNSNDFEGWAIDDFKIQEVGSNIRVFDAETTYATKNSETFNTKCSVLIEGLELPSFDLPTFYYFSDNEIFDEEDILIGIKTNRISKNFMVLEESFDMIPNLSYGDYYIFANHNATHIIDEINEDDNISRMIFHVDSIFTTPFRDDFESGNNVKSWNTYSKTTQYSTLLNTEYWKLENNSLPKIFGTHSGNKAWYISKNPVSGDGRKSHFLESPYIHFSDDLTQVFCFWYKLSNEYHSTSNVDILISNNPVFPYFDSSISPINSVESGRFYDWDCKCIEFEPETGLYSKIGFSFESYAHYTNYADLMVVDDIYIGAPLPDLSIEHSHIRTLNSNQVADTLFYNLFNSGLKKAPSSFTQFFWSNDSILDDNDELLGTALEPSIEDTSFSQRSFSFTLPQRTSGKYYIFSIVDSDNFIEEMWETNNVKCFPIILEPTEMAPYENNFEVHSDKWYHNSLFGKDNWQWDIVETPEPNNMPTGRKAMLTLPVQNDTCQSLMLLYTPVFDISEMNTPVLEFDMGIDYPTYSDRINLNMSYSIDNGATWTILDTLNQSFKTWYYPMEFNSSLGEDLYKINSYMSPFLFAPSEKTFVTSKEYQSRDATRLDKYILDISQLKNHPRIQFRYNLITTNKGLIGKVIIDNFKIKEKYIDLSVTYKKKLYKSPYSKQLNFFMHIDNTGNYLSEESSVAFYLSKDSLLDENDVYIGSELIPAIKPDSRYYFNSMLTCPVPLLGYSYLIYKLDDQNTNSEINENNNIGHWPLLTEGLTEYPYLNDFEDTVVQGWNHYVFIHGKHYKNKFRLRNKTAPNEVLHFSSIKSGQMFTDRVATNTYSELIPTWYLESPNFNFTDQNIIKLSFDLLCVSRPGKGGCNLEYSTDGGLTWIILDEKVGLTTNWYNNIMTELNSEYGWSGFQSSLLNRSIDISSFAEESSVLFRFKFKSNYSVYSDQIYSNGKLQGMRIDNFQIESDALTKVEELLTFNFEMTPNPTEGILAISVDDIDRAYSLRIYNLQGEVVFFQGNIDVNVFEVNCSHLNSGAYIVELNGQQRSVKKLIIR